MSAITNSATADELAAALTRLLTAHLVERPPAPTAIVHDRLHSGMFFVLHMASISGDSPDEQLVHDALADRPARVFAAAFSAVDVMWREAMGLEQTCDA